MIESLHRNAPLFVGKILSELRAYGISEIDRWDIDHLCFRTESEDDYRATKTLLSEFADLLIESPINGRSIATYRLKKAVNCGDRTINVLEIPAPKKNRPYARGLEHIEIVVDEPLTRLRDRFPQLEWDESGLSSIHNPELTLSLEKAVVKFHPMPLESVIEWEKHDGYRVASDMRLFESLSDFSPRISGSIPIGVSTIKSDVDILCHSSDLARFAEKGRALFGKEKDFETHALEKYGVSSIVVNFTREGIPFQIFAQKLPVEEQVSNRHLLIEARLLKLAKHAREAVRALKTRGTKTEVAFGEVFRLTGDPYLKLLDLQTLSESELRAQLGL